MNTKQKFKTGDKVICINEGAYDGKLKNGNIYTIAKVKHDDKLGYIVYLKEWPDDKFFASRFILTPRQDIANRIVITQRAYDWHVCFESNPKKWECAKTYTEALGKLMISHYKEFNISEIAIERKTVDIITLTQ